MGEIEFKPDVSKNHIVQNEFCLIEKLKNTNHYQSRNWNTEQATRYIFQIRNSILEASFFAHFWDTRFIKSVVELPTSFGCPVGCKHCASTLLSPVRQLSTQDIKRMAFFVLDDRSISFNDSFLVTYSGIGEGAFHRNRLKAASLLIYERFPKSYYTFTTVGFDPTFVEFCDDLARQLPCHYLQISYLHYNVTKLVELVPTVHQFKFDFERLVGQIKETRFIKVRLNYVVIKDFNDTPDHWEEFMKMIRGLESKIVLRISRLNETQASHYFNVQPPSYSVLTELSEKLNKAGFNAYAFASAFNDNLNCGQLAWKYTHAVA